MKRICAIAALAVTALPQAPAMAQDALAGETLYQNVCRTCHGPTAKGMASFPRLTGHDAAYLTGRLQTYRAGDRVGPNTALMAPHAKALSDADIANVAAYIVTTLQ